MPVTPRELLSHAESLHERSTGTELEERTIISRGYYATHHACKEIADTFTLPQPQAGVYGSHAKLYSQLTSCCSVHHSEHMTIKRIGYMANGSLKPYRVWADYEIEASSRKGACADALAKSAFILQKVDELLDASTGDATKTAMI